MRIFLAWLALLGVGISLSYHPEPPAPYEVWRGRLDASVRLQEADREVRRFIEAYGVQIYTGAFTGILEAEVDRELIQFALDRGATDLPVIILWNETTVGKLVADYDQAVRHRKRTAGPEGRPPRPAGR